MILSELMIRHAVLSDASAIAEIYNAAALEKDINYEIRPHSTEDRRQWLERNQGYPVLIAENNGERVGYAALSPFHSNFGYRHTATGSIYLKPDARHRGVGTKLLALLREAAMEKEIHTIIGGVNSKNLASLALLKSFGFVEVGYFKEVGFKNGEWLDDVCLQLILNKEKR